MKRDTIQNKRAFEDDLCDVLQEHLSNAGLSGDDSVLAINPRTREATIVSRAIIPSGVETYGLSPLYSTDDNDAPIPDIDAVTNFASQYFLVR